MRFVLLLFAACALSACGLQPIYAGASGKGAVADLSAVDIAPIEGRDGWLVAPALEDRVSLRETDAPPRYRLDVQLDDQLESLGLLRRERFESRYWFCGSYTTATRHLAIMSFIPIKRLAPVCNQSFGSFDLLVGH